MKLLHGGVRLSLVVVGVLLICGGVLVGVVVNTNQNINDNQIDHGSKPTTTGKLSSRFMFSGTVVTARAVENEARDLSGVVQWEKVFSGLSSFESEKYAEWFVDIECPVTNEVIPYRQQVSNTIFNCPPSVLPEMSKYFTVANIANNHTRDLGDEGFSATQKNLVNGGMQIVGHWDPRQYDDNCEVIGAEFTLQLDGEDNQTVELPIAVCAFHHFETAPIEEDFAIVSSYAERMPVIGLMQVGAEYRSQADARQQEVARQLIDSGVDFVVGNSPHWVQNTEVYKGKLIVYSTGNFIFDQLDQETNRGLSLDVSIETNYNEVIESWLELSSECQPAKHKDQCFVLAQSRNLPRYQLDYNFDIIASIGGFKQITRKAPAEVQNAVEDRANWQKTLQALQEN